MLVLYVIYIQHTYWNLSENSSFTRHYHERIWRIHWGTIQLIWQKNARLLFFSSNYSNGQIDWYGSQFESEINNFFFIYLCDFIPICFTGWKASFAKCISIMLHVIWNHSSRTIIDSNNRECIREGDSIKLMGNINPQMNQS